jgi:23S rRNA (pseudouridine1915-N3)-methyltransferase
VKTTLLAIGKLRPAFREACDGYLARLRRYGEFVERQLREGPGEAGVQRRQEGVRLIEAVPDRATVVALDRQGTGWTSEALAKAVGQWRDQGRSVALVIGGATGLDDAVLLRADHRWSLGPLTLPHELARVVVLEQWYRAWTILRGERYHK